tara:strand:- start:274 stop:669 length:396 start_codon:yes stop_codon:yes gene_type:complete
MDVFTLVICGIVGFWVYWSVKHEGVIWIIRTATVLGSGVFFIWMTFKIQTQLNPAWFAFFVNMSSFAVLSIIVWRIVMWCENEIERRVGSDPYKEFTKKTKEQEQMQVYEEALILDEIMEKDKKENKEDNE